jgi:2-amino-4-hydroxy-6-hydroxymethyldihydropteridine diphosphokinase
MLVYLALGSNLGDRQGYLAAAVDGLARGGLQVLRSASVYSSEPHDLPGEPWFLNTVVEANTILAPEQLLERCISVEEENFRRRTGMKASRTLDIDIIFYGDWVIDKPELKIPHPAFRKRKFVLEPLAELAPQFIDPLTGMTVQHLLEEVQDAAELLRFGPPLL